MELNELVVVTMTRIQSAEDAAILIDSLQALAAHNVPLIVAHSGDSPAFLADLRALPNTRVLSISEDGLYAQMRAAFAEAYASRKPYILYTEPDKKGFFQDLLATFLGQVPPQVGVAVASRNDEALRTFPRFQQYTESTASKLAYELTGYDGDAIYGPLLFSRDFCQYLDRLPAAIGWGWRLFLITLCARLKAPLVYIPLAGVCPRHQQAEDQPADRIYRIRQLDANIQGMLLGASIALDTESLQRSPED